MKKQELRARIAELEQQIAECDNLAKELILQMRLHRLLLAAKARSKS